MKYSEDSFQLWTTPLSEAEEKRAENAIKMIRSAIDSCEALSSKDIDIFTQGSFANNTNVRSESDVDVCVMLKDSFHLDLPDGWTRADYGFAPSTTTFGDYRNMVKMALQQKFRSEYVVDGNKSIKIDENTYHVKADVVPAFQLRNYYYWNSTNPNLFVEGTWFRSLSGKEVKNYPKEHIKNGVSKNNETNREYKKLVRIMKHVRNEMVDDGKCDGEKISSFLVENLVWNIPSPIITNCSSWTETVKQAIIYLYNEIKSDGHNQWTEVSKMLYLFINRKWTAQDAKQWLYDAWNYLECDK